MDQYNEKLNQIQKKAQQLASAHVEIKEKYANLKQENAELLKLLKEQGLELEEMESKMKVLKVAKQLAASPDDDKSDLKKKINEYIKEIDKCVALLNN
jgi:hypothetical protein